MSSYEICTIIISVFTAFGTCGATILALYFWLNDKKIKLKFRNMHAETYGNLETVEGGYFVVVLTNTSYWPITVEIAGLKIYLKKKAACTILKFFTKKPNIKVILFKNTPFDSLPKQLTIGSSFIHAVPMDEMRNLFQTIIKEQNLIIDKIKIFVCVSSANRDIHFRLDKTVEEELRDS